MTVLLAVWGASPGVGKSTLCAGLSSSLAAAGTRVDHFREEEVLTRPQFAAVAEEFQATGTVELRTLLAATQQFVDAVDTRETDVVIADALVPFVPTLLAMGHGDQAVEAFIAELAAILAPLTPIMVYLDGSAETGLKRAAERDGPQWLEWYLGKLGRYNVSPRVTDLASAAVYLRRERAATLDAARRHGWGLVQVQHATEMTPDQVLLIAQQGLQQLIATSHTAEHPKP
jgi:hypothetical protein